MTQAALKYGAAAGGILSLLILIPFFFVGNGIGFMAGEILGYTSMILSLLAVFFGIRSYRDKFLEGKINFSKAFIAGIYITLIAAVIFGIFTYILYAIVDPGFLDRFASYSMDEIRKSTASTEVIAKKISEMKMMEGFLLNPFWQAFTMFGTVLALGLIVSAVSAAILKKKS